MKILFTRCAIAITLSMGINAIVFANPVPVSADKQGCTAELLFYPPVHSQLS
jgi:hypothetical protein